MSYDFVIKNALIADGSLREPFKGDLAVQDGEIAAIGPGLSGGKETIDAGGLVLMPGIIDGHTHLDAQITWDPFVDPSVSLGVTTIVIGNCGFAIAPCRPDDHNLTMRNLTKVEGMSLEALMKGVTWDFETFPEYLTMLERQGVGPNVVSYIGHSSLRTYVLGKEAPYRAATEEEIVRMAAIVADGMASGAVGFSTSRNDAHNGHAGLPMPSRLADTRELEALTIAMASTGRGIFMIARSENTSIDSIESLTAKSGRPSLISAFLVNNANPQRHVKLLDQVAAARTRGHMLCGQVMCSPLTRL